MDLHTLIKSTNELQPSLSQTRYVRCEPLPLWRAAFMIHVLSSSPFDDFVLHGISCTALSKSGTSVNEVENESVESSEIEDSRCGVDGIRLAVMFGGMGTVSAKGASCDV